VYIPGCPPRPEALLEGVVLLQQRIKNEDMAAKWRGDEFTTQQATRERERLAAAPEPEAPAAPDREPIVVGGGPIE